MTPQSGNQVSTSLGNSGLCWTVFARYRDTAVPAEGNGDLQTLICVLVARPRWYPTLSNPVPWQNWMAAYLGYTVWMKTLFRGWPVMGHDMHVRRRRNILTYLYVATVKISQWYLKRFKSYCVDKHTHTHKQTLLKTIPPLLRYRCLVVMRLWQKCLTRCSKQTSAMIVINLRQLDSVNNTRQLSHWQHVILVICQNSKSFVSDPVNREAHKIMTNKHI